MNKIYWHKLGKHERVKVFEQLESGKLTESEYYEKYKKPDWCNFILALDKNNGCMKLALDEVKKSDDCKRCKYFIGGKSENQSNER